MDFIHVVTVSDVVSALMLVVGVLIQRELHHINENINAVKDYAEEAKDDASKAHERIDLLLTNLKA
jgi:hypothetical protein